MAWAGTKVIPRQSHKCHTYLERCHVRNTAMCLNCIQLIQAPVQFVHGVHGEANVWLVARCDRLIQRRSSWPLWSVGGWEKSSRSNRRRTRATLAVVLRWFRLSALAIRQPVTYFEVDWMLVKLTKLFRTDRRLAKICANGVTIKSSPPWLHDPRFHLQRRETERKRKACY